MREIRSLFGVRMYKFDTNIKKCSISQFGNRGLSDWQIHIPVSEQSRLGIHVKGQFVLKEWTKNTFEV